MTPFTLPNYFEPWLNYRHAAVRQLAFALASPNILNQLPAGLTCIHHFEFHSTEHWQQHYKAYEPRLAQLDVDPTQLLQFLAQLKSTRLGLRFEMLMWFWLLDCDYHHYELLGHSIQMIEGAKTLGELDFLLFNHETRKVEHWEVALKYYLAEADLSLPHWYGLNRSDTLGRKLRHFTEKQFQFKEAASHQIEQRFAIMKGQLYLPRHGNLAHTTVPHWVNSERRCGTWGRQILNQPHIYRLQRHEWICPDQDISSDQPSWWTDGLYLNEKADYYMYRAPHLLSYNQHKL